MMEYCAMMKTGAFLVGLMAFGLVFGSSAEAGRFRLGHGYDQFQVSQYADESQQDGGGSGAYAISPSEAASIARGTWPGAKVLRVQLLPSGVYAVTLKQGGEVSRVLVDANSGQTG
jgi:uncharacterized membrane protein YkoI